MLQFRNDRRRSRRAPARLRGFGVPGPVAFLGMLALLLTAAPLAFADDKRPAADPVPEPVFQALEAAWSAGDAEALAALVQVDGIRVTLGSHPGRATEYSPSQSLYYFQGLFRTRQTREFRFTRLQEVGEGERAHAMAIWRFTSPSAPEEKELRLVFLLTRQDDVWRLSEINKITVR